MSSWSVFVLDNLPPKLNYWIFTTAFYFHQTVLSESNYRISPTSKCLFYLEPVDMSKMVSWSSNHGEQGGGCGGNNSCPHHTYESWQDIWSHKGPMQNQGQPTS